MPQSKNPKTIPASTVVIFRRAPDGEGAPQLLMLQRSREMRFAGGAVVFPGGRIDPKDYDLACEFAPNDPLGAARIAGIRETLEESGLAIGISAAISASEAAEARKIALGDAGFSGAIRQFGWTLQPEALISFAHWCPQWDGAFDTHFFLADLGTGAVDIKVDHTENTRLFWASAKDALAMADAGEIHAIFPTRRNLERLAQFASFAEARIHAMTTPVRMITPNRVERDGKLYLTIPDGLGYPITSQAMENVQRG